MRFTRVYVPDDPDPKLAVWDEALQGWVLLGCFWLSPTNIEDLPIDDMVDANIREIELFNRPIWGEIRKALDGISLPLSENFPIYGWNGALPPYAPLFSRSAKILCVGLNYAEHIKEFNHEFPTEPVIFCKASSAINYYGADILIPDCSTRVDYEGELVVVVGAECRNVSEEDALEYVAGYCVGNDVSARDWQKDKPGGQWLLGKSFDSFAPIGPWFVTRDEVGDPNDLAIETRVNGKVMQSSSTKNFIFKIPQLISYLSQVMTLKPGDLIFTGTPNGVGDVRKPPVYLQPGDVVSVEIEKVGKLVNPVRRYCEDDEPWRVPSIGLPKTK
ncbi:MAG: fumarylacetoacetate hydrolase family protein [Thermoguttaceae bacterium]|nr:fumarylacetoacetate hydrolase family protein [Thermoguttaceae bacterium]